MQLGGAQGLSNQGTFNANQQTAFNQQGLQGLLGAASGQNALGGINTQGAGFGLGQLGNLFELGLGGFSAERSPLAALAGLFDPILQSQQTSASSGQTSSSGGGSFGLDLDF